MGVCVRQRRGLTLACGSPHTACTSETDTFNTYKIKQKKRTPNRAKCTRRTTLESKQTGYLQCNGAGLQGGVGREAELHSRVSGGDQQGSSLSQRAAVPHWAGHHHEPGEVAHGTAGELQRPQDTQVVMNVLTSKQQRWIDAAPWLDVHRGDCCGPGCPSAARWAECPRTSRQTSAPEHLAFLTGGTARTPPLAGKYIMHINTLQVTNCTFSCHTI